MKKTELSAMIVSELKALAKKMKVALPSGGKKADIVKALSAVFQRKNKTTAAEKTSRSTRKTTSTRKIASARKAAGEKRVPAGKPAKAAMPAREWKLPPGAEEPLMAQERVSEAKYYTGPAKEERPGPPYEDLPHGYGEEKIALMVRDPYLVHAYWEVTPARIEREKAWFGWNSKLDVRIYDVTGIQFDGRNSLGFFDQEVFERLGSWYFDVGRPSHSFVADIGLLSPEGRFLTLASSNHISMPRERVSEELDEEWMLVDEEFWKLYGFPGGSSAQSQEMIKRRRTQQITSPGTFSRAKRK